MNAALWLLWILPLLFAAQTQAAARESGPWAREAVMRAVSASAAIEDPFRRAQSLAEIAEIESNLTDTAAAVTILQSASESASKIDNASFAGWARHDIATGYVKAGALEEAQRIADTIGDSKTRDEVLEAIVAARRTTGDLAGALAVAHRMQDAAIQGRALRAIVIAQSAAGATDEARATARDIPDPAFSALALGDVAAALAREKRTEEGRQLALSIRNDSVRGDALAEIAAVQIERDDASGALATVAKIDDRLTRANALAKLARVRAGHGSEGATRDLFKQSITLARSGRAAPARRCSTFVEIARSQVAAGDLSGARETLQLALGALQGVKQRSDRLALRSQIVPMQARVGDHAGAMATAWKAEDASLRPLLVRDVTASQTEAGDVAGALQAARSLDDRQAGAAAFFGILRAQSEAKDASGMHDTIEAALETVRVIRGEELKAGALGALAAARLAAGERDGARLLFDEAMTVAAASADASAQAASFVRIADALVERGR